MNEKIQLKPINHIALVLDESSSMDRYPEQVIRVFDEQIQTLARRSKELNQETRVSVYKFSNDVQCIAFDCDVLRMPSLRGQYQPNGQTALVDGAMQAVKDLKLTPELYADHAYLVYVVTDGMENHSRTRHDALASALNGLPDHWTVAAFVPNSNGAALCERLGFPVNNIQCWDVSSKQGLSDMVTSMSKTTDNYMRMRAAGVRGTKSLFVAQVAAKRSEVTAKLKVVTNPYTVFAHPAFRDKQEIKKFVEERTGKDYMIGSAFYGLVKPETIQSHKRIMLRTIPDGRLYSGTTDEVRAVLGMPAGVDLKVQPGQSKDFQIFVESTSVNRHVVPGQEVLVIKL